MQEEALQRFLASVRCERFIDYLDPIGETAGEALARRVRWARMTRNDPAHADEAMFLLQHELALRNVVSEEVEADNQWVEAAPAGEGAGWSRGTTESTSLEEGAINEESLPTEEEHPTGIMRMEDLSLDGIDGKQPTLDPEIEPTEHLTPTPAPINRGTREAPENKPPLAPSPASLLQPRGAVRTANPVMNRVHTPTFSTLPGMNVPNPTLMPPDDEPSLPPKADDEQTEPSARMAPELMQAIAEAATGKDFDPVVVGSGGDPDAATVRPPDARDHLPPTAEPDPVAIAPPKPVPAPTLGPKDEERQPPWLIIGIVAALLVGVGLWFTSQTGSTAGTKITSVPITTPAPVGPTSTGPKALPATPTVPKPAPEPADAHEPTTPEPVAPAPTPVKPAPTPVATAPTPVATAPTPVAPAPTPVATAPTPVAPAPTPVAPVAPVPGIVAPAPGTAAPAPVEPAPVAPPAPAPVAPRPAAPEPVAPVSTPEPPSGVSPAAVKGLWGGTMGGRGFVLLITSQNGEQVSGSAEVLEASGSWSKYKVSGTIKGNTISLADAGGTVLFAGSVDGTHASGSMQRDGQSSNFSINR